MGGVRAKIGLTGQLDRRQPGNYFKPWKICHVTATHLLCCKLHINYHIQNAGSCLVCDLDETSFQNGCCVLQARIFKMLMSRVRSFTFRHAHW